MIDLNFDSSVLSKGQRSYWSLSALLVRFLALCLTSREFQMLFLVLACDSFVVLCLVWWLVSAPICFLVCGGVCWLS